MENNKYNEIIDETYDYLNENHNFAGSSLKKLRPTSVIKIIKRNLALLACCILIVLNLITYIYLNYINVVDTSEVSKAVEELSNIGDANPLLFNTIKQITDKKNADPKLIDKELKILNKKMH